jgi:hypothetical protein
LAYWTSARLDGVIDPYDPPHPDGPLDPEDVPGPPLADISWLHDDEPDDQPYDPTQDEWISDFRPHLEDPP